MATEQTTRSRSLQWPEPLTGLRGIKVADLPREISAGITLAALIIPLNIGYAQICGLPATFGLYAGIIPLALFALFTSSRQMVGSPDAPIAALLGSILIAFAPIEDPQLRMQYALAISLICGLFFFVFWYFRLAFLAKFLSRAVLAGFITGLGIEVFTNQVRRAMSAPHAEISEAAQQIHDAMASSFNATGYFVEVIALLKSIPHANLYSVAIAVSAFVIVRLMKRYTPKIPGALTALVLLTVVVAVFDLDKKGVTVLGTLPSGLPSLTIPQIPAADYMRLVPGALAIVGITLAEALLLVRSYDRKSGDKSDGNQVLFAYGVTSVAGGFSGSLVMGPSASRSAAVEDAGARTQLPSLVAAGAIALVMIFFTDELAYLPNAALAGIVANAVLKLIEVEELKELLHMRRSEFWVAIVCLVSVLMLGPLRAVIIAFLFSTIDILRRASTPDNLVLREAPDGSHFIPEEEDQAPDASGMIIYRFGAPLYFANASLFEEEVEELITKAATPVKWFVLDTEAVNDIDTTGAEVLHQVLTWLKTKGVTIVLSRTSPNVANLLAHYHLLDLIGETRLYPTNRHAIAAYRHEHGQPGPEADPGLA